MKDSKFAAYIGIFSAIITIGDCFIRTIQNAEFTLSPISKIGLAIFVLALVLCFVFKDDITYYNIKKIVCYYMRNRDSYLVENKECLYTYKSRTEMEYTKKHDIVSNVNNLKHFCDKFKWFKEQKIEDIDIKSSNPNHKITVRRVENWHQYTVEFDELGKKQRQSIDITISNLHDPQKEAIPFLSSNIICKTKKLRLAVFFKSDNIKPINIKYKIYDNYASDFPLFQKDLSYNVTEDKIEVVEEKPIYGYRYEIAWSFEND